MTISKTNFILGAAVCTLIGFIFGVVASKGYYENLAEEIINDEVEAQVKRLRQMDEEKAERTETSNENFATKTYLDQATEAQEETPVMYFITKQQYEEDETYEKIDLYVNPDTGFVKDRDGTECAEYNHILDFVGGFQLPNYVRNEYTMVDYHLKDLEVDKNEG